MRLALALALTLAACASPGQEIGPDGRPHAAVMKVTLFRCAFWRWPCDAR